MSWNYRVVKNGEYFGIHEAYYDEQLKLISLTVEAVPLLASTPDDLVNNLNLMLDAFKKPIVDYESLNDSEAGKCL